MTVNVSTAAQNTAISNMYSSSFVPQMANDFFGSQIFGSNPFGFQANGPVFTTAANDSASSIVQQYAYANGAGVSGAPTLQDYAYATQIANMFANQNAMLSPYTGYMQNDIFAQQALPMMFNNGQAFA